MPPYDPWPLAHWWLPVELDLRPDPIGLSLRQRAGLEVSPHTLRHTFGTRLAWRQGVHLVTVAAMMGHESLETTALYTKPSEEDMA